MIPLDSSPSESYISDDSHLAGQEEHRAEARAARQAREPSPEHNENGGQDTISRIKA